MKHILCHFTWHFKKEQYTEEKTTKERSFAKKSCKNNEIIDLITKHQ